MSHLKFAKNIKKKYQERLINREQQWPYCHGEKLISLNLIEGERGQKEASSRDSSLQLRGRPYHKEEEKTQLKRTPIVYADIFKVEGKKKSVRKVLVEGDAGIGKTTLCTIMSEDWANDKLFQQFELLLLLPLREREVAKASSLLELLKLFHPSENICTSVAHFLEEDDGENTVIIADGWDELGVPERNEDTFLYKLLFGKIFPFMSVVVTSRYSASASLHNLPHIDRFIEVYGFNKESITEFIESEFTSDRIVGRNLLKKLKNSPLIGSVCSVPLCCVIICHLWRTLQEDLPTTITKLYTKITLNILIRNVRKSLPQYKDTLSFSNFDSLPEDLKQSWNLLCEFAFLTIKEDQVVFSRDELTSFWPHSSTIDENIFRFGLLQAAQSIIDVGSGMSFHFLHLTFQEFLAALHLSRQPLGTQIQVCNKYTQTGRFDMVVRFLFGIVAQTCSSEAVVDKLLNSIGYACTPLTICHSLFEAGHTNVSPVQDVCNRLFSGNQMHHSYSAHDSSALLHVITHSNQLNLASIAFTDHGITSNQIATFGRVLADKKGQLQVESLSLSGNNLTDGDMSAVFSEETVVAFRSLEHLSLDCNVIGARGLECVMTTLKSAQLMRCILDTLDLSHNPLGISGLQTLEHTIHSGALRSLVKLSLQGSLTDDADTNATLLISLSASLTAYCPIFTRLDVSENKLGLPGARALGTVMSQLTQHENIYGCNINLTCTNFHCCPLFSYISLKFSSCKLQSISINLSDNPIGLDGVITIGHMISNNQITKLHLNRCQLTCDATLDPLVKGQSSNSDNVGCQSSTVSSVGWKLCTIQPSLSLTVLFLNGNDFFGKKIGILAGFMHLCPLLSNLICCNCGMNSQDLKNLFIRLNEMKSPPLSQLVSWQLDDNRIDDDGISILINNLPSCFPKLKGEWILVEHNLVSEQMAQKLNESPNQVIVNL